MSRRKEINFFKYTKLDPTDDEVFFGPITLRELKKSVEVEEEVVRRRREAKKKEKEKQAQLQNKENEDELNRTFEVEKDQDQNSNIAPRTLNDVTQLHHNLDETKLVDLSFQFSNTSIKPVKPAAASKKTKCLLDETVAFNESKIGSRLWTPLLDKVIQSKKSESKKDRLDFTSKESIEKTIPGTPRLVKLSDTFITDVDGDTVLNNTIPDDPNNDSENTALVGTPDIFTKKRNEIWENASRSKSKLPKRKSYAKDQMTFFTKSPSAVLAEQLLPKKKTHMFAKSPAAPKLMVVKNKTPTAKEQKPRLFTQSPISDYIHRGIEVKSMSKARHSGCVQELDVRSKTDYKSMTNCKIPIPTSANAKRKLNLN